MIVESIVLGASSIIVSWLWINERISKRRNEAGIEEPKPEPPVIDKFIRVVIGTPCPKCGEPAKNEVRKNYAGYYNYSYVVTASAGPAVPRACGSSSCPADKLPHLHASCFTCNYKWFMAPADYVEKKKPKTDLELFDDILKENEKCRQDTPTK